MKTLSAALSSHLSGELSTLAELVKMTRADGSVFGFTTHDANILYEGVTYSADGAYSGGKFSSSASLKASSYEITGLLESDALSEDDLKAGLFDHARIDIYVCNWADLSMGVIQIRRGWLGEATLIDGHYVIALRGLHDLLQRRVGDVYTAECRYAFCSDSCRLARADHTVSGSVTGVTDRSTFSDTSRSEEDGVFSYGLLSWTSGLNKGLSMEVQSWTLASTSFSLWLPMPFAIAVGDAYSVLQGCDKKFSTCRDRFSNAINFGGFPHLPGLDKILQYPDNQ